MIVRIIRTRSFFFSYPIYYPRTTLVLPPSSNSDQGSHSGPPSPFPTTVRAFVFIASIIQHFLPLSTCVELYRSICDVWAGTERSGASCRNVRGWKEASQDGYASSTVPNYCQEMRKNYATQKQKKTQTQTCERLAPLSPINITRHASRTKSSLLSAVIVRAFDVSLIDRADWFHVSNTEREYYGALLGQRRVTPLALKNEVRPPQVCVLS